MIGTVRFVFGMALCGVGVARGAALLQQPPLQQPPESTVFHSGTRLVEVEVIVRDKSGTGPRLFGPPGAPVKGLTKDDFTLLDEGKPQPIAVFSAGPSSDAKPGDAKPIALPPGAVSNRQDSRGQPLNGVTVVLIDQLNTHFDLKGYEHLGVTNLLRSLTKTDRIALYSLGKDLHILQDFTDDPQKLTDAIAKLDQGLIPVDPATIVRDGDDPVNWAAWAEDRNKVTVEALNLIIQHLAGVPGRKNLVWLENEPTPPAAIAMAQQANIALYPVLVRAVGDYAQAFNTIARERAARSLAAATGGSAFFDVMDLTVAVRAAEEDSANAYVLGFYPAEDALDGRYHNITVKLHNKALTDKAFNDKAFEIRYRPGYLAARPSNDNLANDDLIESPVNLAGVGLTAEVQSDPARPGLRQLHLTVDLHDLRLEPGDGRLAGAFDFLVFTPASNSTRAETIQVNFPAAQLEKALETGYAVNVGGIDAQTGELRVVVRDRSTGATGALRIPIEKSVAK